MSHCCIDKCPRQLLHYMNREYIPSAGSSGGKQCIHDTIVM